MRLSHLQLERAVKRLFLGGIIIAMAVFLSHSHEISRLEAIRASGKVKLITRPGPLTYYEDAKGENGFEYLLAQRFAEHLSVELVVSTTESLTQMFHMLGGPNADFAGATLTITPERRANLRFSEPYGEVEQIVLHRRGTPAPRDITNLIDGQVAVIAGSSHEEHLEELKREHPELAWIAIEDIEMIELMEMVDAGELEYAVVDSTTFHAHRTMYPNASSTLTITEPQALAWAFPRNGDDSLVQAANQFLRELRSSGQLADMQTRFFAELDQFSVSGSILFLNRLRSRLPLYREEFERMAQLHGIDWHLLAAIAYQESHWNPMAVSHTGVRGMMMLTRKAASEVNVRDRHDPVESIRGGTEYFLQTLSRIPDAITGPDRIRFALAAYNVGLGHLEDARVLTQRAGRDPNLWEQVENYLPLLQRQKYYSTVRHGYARGHEPVHFVRNVLRFQRLLQWNTIEENRRLQREQRQAPPELQEWHPDSLRTL